MSIVNLNITFVKKQKQTRPTPNAQLKAGARHSLWQELVVFTLKTDHSCETGYPFDNSPQIFVNGIVLILNEQFAWLYPSIWRKVWRWIIRFTESLSTAAPSPQNKSEKGCLGGRGRLASLKRIIHISTSLKINGTNLGNKFFYG